MNDILATNQDPGPEPSALLRRIEALEQAEGAWKKEREVLIRSEARFRGYFNSPLYGIAVTSPEKGWIEVNDRLCSLLGYTREEILQRTWTEMTYPDDLALDLAQFDRVLSGEIDQYAMEKRFFRKDGQILWTNLSVGCVRKPDGGVDHIIAVVEDITAARAARDQLRESEEKYRLLFNHSKDAILLTAPDGTILDVNPATCEMFGRSPEAIRRMGRRGLVDMTDPRVQAALELRAHKGSGIAEITMIRANGEKFPAEIASTIFIDKNGRQRASMIIRDLSERMRAEESLRKQYVTFRKLAVHVPGMIYQFKKDPDGTYSLPFATEAIGELFGCIPEDVREDYSAITNVVFPEDRDKLFASIEASAASMTRWECEFRVQPPGSSIRWILGRATPEKLEDGSILWHGYASDITENKKAREALGRINEELEEKVLQRTRLLEAANKELEAFSYSVSHDLRAPLRAIQGFSRILREDYPGKPLDEEGKSHLERVSRAAGQMGLLIDDLLKLSRVTRADFCHETFDLSQLAQCLVTDMRENHPDQGVDVSIEGGVMVQGDRNLMKIALMNLLNNAWKFSAKAQKPRIEFGRAVIDGCESVYFVRDNGVGFDMAYAEKLFNPFQRLHTSFEFPGTGIGLATVKRIISRHGGHVWAEGEEGKGATVYFTLP